VDTVLSVGERSNGQGDLLHLYQTAKQAQYAYFFEEKDYIDYAELMKADKQLLPDFKERRKRLLETILLAENPNEIVSEIMECVRLLKQIRYGNNEAFISSCLYFANYIHISLIEYDLLEEDAESHEEFLKKIGKKRTYRALRSAFEEFASNLAIKRFEHPKKDLVEIARIKEFLKKNCTENLSLDIVAAHIGMNPTYFSAFFKKKTGQNFKDYLVGLRMKEALKLIHATDMKIYELAHTVGYKDVNTFSDNFRKAFGMSPQQYKNRVKL
jgi:two-component system response regulator YesN